MLIELTRKPGRPSEGLPPIAKPVWVNATGINSVEAANDGGTWVRMDDGTGYLVTQDVSRVVELIEKEVDA